MRHGADMGHESAPPTREVAIDVRTMGLENLGMVVVDDGSGAVVAWADRNLPPAERQRMLEQVRTWAEATNPRERRALFLRRRVTGGPSAAGKEEPDGDASADTGGASAAPR